MTNAIIKNPVVTSEEAERLVQSVQWFHRVEVIPGLIANGHVPSSGSYDARNYIDSLGISDLRSKRVLELGTWDGPLAFELAARGVEVVASDIQDPARTGFNVLKKISGFDVPYVRCSVYELSKHFKSEFDVVLYFGVFYHLKHPILSFEQVAKCLKVGGLLYTEGEGLGRHIEDLEGNQVPVDDDALNALEHLDRLGVPLTLSYIGRFARARNWIIPNHSALKGWLKNAGLKPESIYTTRNGSQCRIGAKAVKTHEETIMEHQLTGETGGYSKDIEI